MFGGYYYKDLTDTEKLLRRTALDSVVTLTWCCHLAVSLFICAYLGHTRRSGGRMWRWERWLRAPIPGSRCTTRGGLESVGDVLVFCGWMCWMVWLCVRGAGDDYLHLTKAFGAAAAGSLPLQVLLSMKRSPFRHAIRCFSYEGTANVLHQRLGRIIYTLASAHVCLYLKFFWDTSRMSTRLLEPDVLCGVASFTILSAMITSSHPNIRHYFYAIFYRLHILLAALLLPTLYYHTGHLYLLLTLGLSIADRLLRSISVTSGTATINPNESLTILDITLTLPNTPPLPPASHVLITIPSISPWAKNPFTVVESSRGTARLVARVKGGLTKHLSKQSRATLPVSVENGYGCHPVGKRSLEGVDRVLVVAGGIGGTFALAWARYAKARGIQTRFVWAVRRVDDLVWAGDGIALAEVHVTGKVREEEEGDGDEGVELLSIDRESLPVPPISVSYGRPNVRGVVREVVGDAGRVVVVVCGPHEMAWEVKREVGGRRYEYRDLNVYVEAFGY